MDKNKRKILVVDDNVPLRGFYADMFRVFGYEAVEIECGESALAEIAIRGKPDLVFMDTEMGENKERGYEVCKRLKEFYSGDVKVIGTSGDHNYEREWREAGADDFTPQPFEIEDLMERVKRLLEEKDE